MDNMLKAYGEVKPSAEDRVVSTFYLRRWWWRWVKGRCSSSSPQSYETSLAIWDHRVLPAIRHKWTRPPPAMQAGTGLTYPGEMEGWVE